MTDVWVASFLRCPAWREHANEYLLFWRPGVIPAVYLFTGMQQLPFVLFLLLLLPEGEAGGEFVGYCLNVLIDSTIDFWYDFYFLVHVQNMYS